SNGTTVLCTATVAADGTWSCTPTQALPAGPASLTATQADQTGIASNASTAAAVTVPSGATNTPGTVGGTTAATLALTLGTSASFGAFTAGVDKTYTASTTANVISTAGDATLTFSDPGHLENGTFSLPDPLQVTLSKSSWTGPSSNEPVTVGFSQHIGA